MTKMTQIEREKAMGMQRLIVLLDKRELKALKTLAVDCQTSMTAISRDLIVRELLERKYLKR